MALTATATTETFYVVASRLAMDKPSLIALPPSRENIIYEVHPKITMDEFIKSVCDELTMKRTRHIHTEIQ